MQWVNSIYKTGTFYWHAVLSAKEASYWIDTILSAISAQK